jgi:hypothetical protein
MMSWTVNMNNITESVCPFHKLGCECSSPTLNDLKIHFNAHTREIQRFQEHLGYFLGPIILCLFKDGAWPKVGEMITARKPDHPFLIEPMIDREDAERYWFEGLHAEDEPAFYEHDSPIAERDTSEEAVNGAFDYAGNQGDVKPVNLSDIWHMIYRGERTLWRNYFRAMTGKKRSRKIGKYPTFSIHVRIHTQQH